MGTKMVLRHFQWVKGRRLSVFKHHAWPSGGPRLRQDTVRISRRIGMNPCPCRLSSIPLFHCFCRRTKINCK